MPPFLSHQTTHQNFNKFPNKHFPELILSALTIPNNEHNRSDYHNSYYNNNDSTSPPKPRGTEGILLGPAFSAKARRPIQYKSLGTQIR
jgi:hypothetical protein